MTNQEIADVLEALLPKIREMSGLLGRVNDPATVALAQLIVDLRDADDAPPVHHFMSFYRMLGINLD